MSIVQIWSRTNDKKKLLNRINQIEPHHVQLPDVAQPEGMLLAAQDADAVAGTADVTRKLTCVKQRVQRNRLLLH